MALWIKPEWEEWSDREDTGRSLIQQMLTECFLSSGKEKYRPEISYLDDTENGDDDTNPVDMELAEGIPISGAGSGYDE